MTEQEKPRLRGLEKFRTKEVHRPTAIAVGEVAIDGPAVAVVEKLKGIPGLSVDGGDGMRIITAFGGAAAVEGVELNGVWHRSVAKIERFEGEKGSGGKFGKGIYFGAGELSGETVDLLKKGGVYRHDSRVRGSFLVVERKDIKDVAEVIKGELGLPPSNPNIRTTIKNEPLTDLLAQHNAANPDRQFDGAIVLMDEAATAAEIAVLPGSADKIKITATELEA